MGEIYLVQHTETEERFALKRIRGDFADEEELIRFRREAELVARLYHPHVVRLRDSNFATAHPYQVYELYGGGTLADRLQRAGTLSPEEAVEVAAKLGQGLGHAHAHGVLHRDLKPENVLFDTVGEPALADFGLARRSVSKGNSLTATGEAIGTPLYMAPEQVMDSKRVDERADLYGLAAITYAMLTGGPPVVGARTVLEAFDMVINEPPPPIRREDVPPRLERVVLRALAKDPDDRPPSVGAWVEELEAALAGGGLPKPLLYGVPLLVAILLVLGAGFVASGNWTSAASVTPSPVVTPTLPQEEPSPTPALTPLGALGAVGYADLKRLVPKRRAWAWLTLRAEQEPVGVSLLLSCTWEGEELRVVIPRARGVEGGRVWDTLWERKQEHLRSVATGVSFWNFSRHGDLLDGGKTADGATYEELAGGALSRVLEKGAAGALFRLLALQEPEEKTLLRRVTWNQDVYTWEPLVWGEWVDSGPGGGPIRLDEAPKTLRGLLENLDLTSKDIGASLAKKLWPSVLTHNLCRNLEGKFFPENGHLALPREWEYQFKPLGSVELEGQPVFSRPGGVVLGQSPPSPTRYLVFGERQGWLQVGWGGGLAWARGDSYREQLGPVFRYSNLPSMNLDPSRYMNVRAKPHYAGTPKDPGKWRASLGESPVLGQIPLIRLYPFLGVLGGPPDDLHTPNPKHHFLEISAPPASRGRKLSQRWAKIQFDDRAVWVSWWANATKVVKGKRVTTQPIHGEFSFPD